MKASTKIMISVIWRRLAQGELLDAVLADYPKLQGEELAAVLDEIGGNNE